MERRAKAAPLKKDIASGRSRHEMRQFDSAAAPRGTDEEATGTPVPSEVVAPWRPRELGHDAAFDPHPPAGGLLFGWPMLLLFLAIAAGVALSFLGH